MDLLEEFLPLIKTHDSEWFAKYYPGPFLLRRRSEEEIRSGPSRAVGVTYLPGQLQALNPDTLVDDMEQWEAQVEIMERYCLYFIEKTNRNIFTNGVTIGRAKNNDLVIPLVSVSKFHAWIQKDSDEFVIYDARSRFGTFVDDKQVLSDGETGVSLSSGSKLRLGEVFLEFMGGSALQKWASKQLLKGE